MKKHLLYGFALVFTVAVVTVRSAWAGSNTFPHLQMRENLLNNEKVTWINKELFTLLPIPTEQRTRMNHLKAILAKQEATKQGIVEPKQIQKFIDEMHQSSQDLDNGYSVNTTAKWEFQSDLNQTLVKGVFENNNLVSHYSCYLGKKERLNISDSITAKSDQQTIPVDPAEVYMTSGEAWRFRNPTDRGLIFTPEDLSLLAGKNPLSMYGAEWKTLSQSTESQIVQTLVEKGDYAPYTVTVTLDKKHDYCPSEILVSSQRRQEHYVVKDWIPFKGTWIPKQVNFTLDRQPRWHMERTWVLDSINQAEPIKVALREDTDFMDYRLLGADLTSAFILNATFRRNPNILEYQFRGVGYDLPTLEKLKKMKAMLHPGEGTPDAGKQSSALPLIGSVMCLVGGVWMFKRRGVS